MTNPAHNRLLSSTAWLKAFVVAVCLAILVLEGWRDWSEREQEVARIMAEMGNLAKSLAQHVGDTLVLADAILIDVVDRIETGGASPAAIATMDEFLNERIQTLPPFKSLAIYGEDGLLLSSSLPGHRYKVDVQDKAFFQHHRAASSKHWFFGPLIRDPLGSEWVMTLSRRIDRPDGNFGGVAQVSIPPRHFANFFSQFDVGSQGSIALFNTDGTLLSRYPYAERAIGTNHASRPWFKSKAASGSYEFMSMVDETPRLSGYQRNHIFPIGVLSAVGRNEALAHWNQEFLFRTTAVALLISMIASLGYGLVVQLRRRDKAEAELAVLAATDGLTGLANRRTFDKTLDAEWRRASIDGSPLSLLLVDIDQFKAFNDFYGHQAGDECLRSVAHSLKQSVERPGNLVARYGGEELVVLLPATDGLEAAATAENIRAQVEALGLRHEASEPSCVLTVSIGIATLRPAAGLPGSSPGKLVRLADRALYQAKLKGRNRASAADAA